MDIFVSNNQTLDSAFESHLIKDAERMSRNKRSRETLIYLNPKDFLKLAEGVRHYDEAKHDTVKGVLSRGESFDALPYLKTKLINGREFKVTGHEGRHRSIYLHQKFPNKLIPIRLIDSSMRWGEDGLSNSEITLEAESSRLRINVIVP